MACTPRGSGNRRILIFLLRFRHCDKSAPPVTILAGRVGLVARVPASQIPPYKARWQSGHAAACKAVYAGSIPTLASNPRSRRVCGVEERLSTRVRAMSDNALNAVLRRLGYPSPANCSRRIREGSRQYAGAARPWKSGSRLTIPRGRKQLHLLQGELWINDRKLYPGEYKRAERGTADQRVWSETGCTCVLITSASDPLAYLRGSIRRSPDESPR